MGCPVLFLTHTVKLNEITQFVWQIQVISNYFYRSRLETVTQDEKIQCTSLTNIKKLNSYQGNMFSFKKIEVDRKHEVPLV